MEWLAKLFTKYPEMGVYLAVGIGYLIGRLEVSWCRTWRGDWVFVGRDTYWEFLPRARVRPSQIDRLPSIPFRNRLLGGA